MTTSDSNAKPVEQNASSGQKTQCPQGTTATNADSQSGYPATEIYPGHFVKAAPKPPSYRVKRGDKLCIVWHPDSEWPQYDITIVSKVSPYCGKTLRDLRKHGKDAWVVA